MNNLTLFTCPKLFTGEFLRIQDNALRSWRTLVGERMILTNAEADTLKWALQFNSGLIQQFKRNEYGTPLMDDLFRVAEDLCETDLIAFVNTDIVLFPDFLEAVDACASLPHFLMVGQRTDVDIDPHWRFNGLTTEAFRSAALERGKRIGVGASDYFVWRKGELGAIPPYAIGRMRWDNALMARAVNRGMALVDATEAVLAIHQNHPPMPRVEGDAELHANDKLVGENEGWLGRLSDATHILTPDFQIREQVQA